MKYSKIFSSMCVVVSLFLADALANPADEDAVTTVTLTLESATELALENSLDIQIARHDALIAQTALDAAESIFDTYLSANLTYSDDQKKPPNTILGNKTTTHTYSLGIEKKLPTGTTISIDAQKERQFSNSSFSVINPYHEATLAATIRQSLGRNFFGLIDRSEIKITKSDIKNAGYTSLDAIESSLASAQTAFWNLVLKDRELHIKIRMREEAGRLYDIYKENYNLGLAEKADLYALEANVKTYENEVMLARLERKKAENELIFELNTESTSLNLMPLDDLALVPARININQVMQKAITHRRDYHILKNRLQAMGFKIVARKNALWPQIDVTASYTRNGLDSSYQQAWQSLYSEENPELTVGVSIELSLENRSARADLKEATLLKSQLLLSLKRLERLILTDISNISRELNMLKERITTDESIVMLQENKLNEEKERLARGRSGSDTLIRFEQDFLNAQLALAQDYLTYRIRLIELERAQNTLLDRYWKELL